MFEKMSCTTQLLTGLLRQAILHASRFCALALLAGWLMVAFQADLFSQQTAEQDSKAAVFFDTQIAPLLSARCLQCHSGDEPKGELNLKIAALASKGGESGPVIVPGKPEDSLLWQHVRDHEMPPKKELPADEIALLKKWIADGAKWGTDPIDSLRFSSDARAGFDWWSLQPIQRPNLPAVKDDSQIRNPIDRFVIARLEDKNLSLSPPADPRILVRRVYFDLIGLPPEPAVVEAFVSNPTDEAYETLVNNLLYSKHYGERWGRHWLDVVRYGESDGFERNAPRNNSWHYRDWVIEALNDDMPFDEFARMQIAGDAITGGKYDGLAASGFLVAGVHNTVVGSSELMKRVARQDELEEVVGTVGQTFIGLTVNCARCHDHKFDPIYQQEFYRMTAVLGGFNHGERDYVRTNHSAKTDELSRKIEERIDAIAALESPVRKQIIEDRKSGKAKAELPEAYASWDFDKDAKDQIGKLHGKLIGGARIEDGALVVDGKSAYLETEPVDIELGEKTLEAWVLLDNLDQRGGGVITVQTTDGGVFDSTVYGEREAKRWMAGSEFFKRTQSFNGPEEAKAAETPVHVAIVYTADGTITAYRNGEPYGTAYKSVGLNQFSAGKATIVFGMRHAPAGSNKMLAGRILKANLYNRALPPEAIAASSGAGTDYITDKELAERLAGDALQVWQAAKSELADLKSQLAQLQQVSQGKMYTANSASVPRTFFLRRGNPMDEAEEVKPGAIASLAALNADLNLPDNAPEADRRVALANWITDPNNPLFARVIANRLWHYHFGVGIVSTPNDFGFNGGRPSHPALLDWLASELRDNEYRLKHLQRLIVTSAAYRQSSADNAAAKKLDAGNRLLWRKSPRRVDAESLRDGMLSVAGMLNSEMGGPGFVDVKIEPNNGTTYYTPIDPEGAEFQRRTVYRFTPRGGRSALLDTFDCPDPSATAPRRSVTTTPLQALSLLNNSFVFRMSDALAERVHRAAGDDANAQIRQAYLTVLCREPSPEDQQLARNLVDNHGMPALCRALFNFSEFVVIE